MPVAIFWRSGFHQVRRMKPFLDIELNMGNIFTRQIDKKEFELPLPKDFAMHDSLIFADKHSRRIILPLEIRYLNIAPEPSAIARYEKLSFRELIKIADEDDQSIELLLQLHRYLAEYFFDRKLNTYDGIEESKSKQITRVKLLLDYDQKWNVEHKRYVKGPTAARALLEAGLEEFVNRPLVYNAALKREIVTRPMHGPL